MALRREQSFIDTAAMPLEIHIHHVEQAVIADGGNDVAVKRRDGETLCDQGKEALCGGEYLCGGAVSCTRFILLFNPGADTARVTETCRGAWLCDGAIDYSGESIYMPEAQSLLDSVRELDWLDTDIGVALDDRMRVISVMA